MDGMRPWNRVRQSTLVSHVVVFVGRLMVAIPEDGEGTLGLGRRQLRLLGLGRDRRLSGRGPSFRDGIQIVLLLQRTGASLSMSAATTVTRILYNLDQNTEPGYNASMLTLEIPLVNGMGV